MIKGYRGRHRRHIRAELLAWAECNPLLITMVVAVLLWLPYGVADAYGYTDALRPVRGTVGTLLPPACPSEAGGEILPCRWECDSMGNRQCGPDMPPRLTYRVAGDGSIEVCAAPDTRSLICAPVESDARIEYVGSDGTLYRLAGGE
jgi:hypothetical protein